MTTQTIVPPLSTCISNGADPGFSGDLGPVFAFGKGLNVVGPDE